MGPPLNLAPPNLIFCSGPPNYFGLKFLVPLKIKWGGGGGGAATMLMYFDNLKKKQQDQGVKAAVTLKV